MSEQFDTKSEAHKIEGLIDQFFEFNGVHGARKLARDAQQKIVDELNTLSPQQLKAVDKEIHDHSVGLLNVELTSKRGKEIMEFRDMTNCNGASLEAKLKTKAF